MSLTTVTRKELKELKAINFKENDVVDVVDLKGNILYSINIHFGEYKLPLRTTVEDKNCILLGCTPGTKNGWPYYIAEFIHS